MFINMNFCFHIIFHSCLGTFVNILARLFILSVTFEIINFLFRKYFSLPLVIVIILVHSGDHWNSFRLFDFSHLWGAKLVKYPSLSTYLINFANVLVLNDYNTLNVTENLFGTDCLLIGTDCLLIIFKIVELNTLKKRWPINLDKFSIIFDLKLFKYNFNSI